MDIRLTDAQAASFMKTFLQLSFSAVEFEAHETFYSIALQIESLSVPEGAPTGMNGIIKQQNEPAEVT